jgi:transcriptional regulator of acetoin/glycerol metabolism
MWVALASNEGTFLELTPEVCVELGCPKADAGIDDAPVGRAEIEAALAGAGGNVSEATRRLGLKSRYVLYRLMKRHDLATPGKD